MKMSPKKILFMLLGMAAFQQVHTQTTIDCAADSAYFDTLNQGFNAIQDDASALGFYIRSTLNVQRTEGREPFCRLISYARIFDFLLSKGARFEYEYNDYHRDKNSNYVFAMGIEDDSLSKALAREMSERRRIYSWHRQLLNVLEWYERIMPRLYERVGGRLQLEKDVMTIVALGDYAHPVTIKNILLMNDVYPNQKHFNKGLPARN